MESGEYNILVESLKLIVQSQLVLADLQRNQKKLEDLIMSLTLGKEHERE